MKKLLYILILMMIVSSCTDYNEIIKNSETSTKEMIVPDGFDFSLTSAVTLKIHVKNHDFSLSDIPIKVYLNDPGTNEEPSTDALLTQTIVSDQNGLIETKLEIPKYISEVYLVTDYIGLSRVTILPIDGQILEYTYGESTGIEPIIKSNNGQNLKSGFNFVPMGTWNSSGVPNYLVSTRDQISQSLLEKINASLPERKRLTESHPDYLEAGNQSNVLIKELADVWVTFVHEGAGYKNTLGYFLYDLENPPATKEDIQDINIIYPNVSFQGGGGGLISGDKVYLGQFEPGKAIGWVLLANGYNVNGNFNSNFIYFSNRHFNHETTDERKQHMVLLHDSEDDLLLMGFEDLNRDGWTDDDFNDAIFYVTSNPVTAIELSDVPPIDTPGDKDSDGVSDTFDDFPEDPDLAYNSHYPAEGQNGTIVAEDLWPSFGDFDFNDLVLEYHFQSMSDANNKVKKMAIDITIMAIGASFRNGFGIELPVSTSAIKSVNGLNSEFDFVRLSSNGTESGQSNAVLVFFEDAYQVLPFVGSGSGVNTDMSEPKSDPVTISAEIEFVRALSQAELGSEPYNPFIIINGERGKEIHLPGKTPTQLADDSYFGSMQDDTNPSHSKYYQSGNNLPWMLNIPATFRHPQEKSDIAQGYKYFSSWATSGGAQNTDWYTDKDGNRDLSKLYTR